MCQNSSGNEQRRVRHDASLVVETRSRDIPPKHLPTTHCPTELPCCAPGALAMLQFDSYIREARILQIHVTN